MFFFLLTVEIKAYGENAPSIMTVIYFDELLKSNQIVLEMVELDDTKLKKEEATFLLKQMKLYYLNKNEQDEKFKLMNCFISKPTEFKHMDLIKQLEIENLKLEINK